MMACDSKDGVKDGVIGNPEACNFDPASLRCKNGASTGQCITDKQVDAVRKIYSGPVDSQGRAIHMDGGGFALGSELNWIGQNVAGEGKNQPATFLSWMEDMFRYMVFSNDPGPTWSRADLNWDTDPARARAHMASIYNATNPDLSAFEKRGGKLIAYQGWIDQQVIPQTPMKYYETAVKTMGGEQRIQEFMRLYMLPGVGHCSGGPGADTIDYLTYLENWVERGDSPDQLLATHYDDVTGRPAFTRPVFAYPDSARYSGRGDVSDAANWRRQKGTLEQSRKK
jgi:feruloyl esterase